MSRTSYWDSVLVVDNEMPEDLLTELLINKPEDLEEGVINNSPYPEDTKYKTKYNVGGAVDKLYEYLDNLGVIPKVEGCSVRRVANFHSLNKGGKMGWHCDTGYSIAVSTYLTGCEGGELQVLHTDATQSVIIAPQRNRVVILKCENHHRVLEVLDGQRESIQIFITYLNDGE